MNIMTYNKQTMLNWLITDVIADYVGLTKIEGDMEYAFPEFDYIDRDSISIDSMSNPFTGSDDRIMNVDGWSKKEITKDYLKRVFTIQGNDYQFTNLISRR